MALTWNVAYTTSHVSVGQKLSLTEEQKRVMYLAGRSAREEQLASDWWRHFAGLFRPCDRCGYLHKEHAIWCPYAD
jgi:hypothetical protein